MFSFTGPCNVATELNSLSSKSLNLVNVTKASSFWLSSESLFVKVQPFLVFSTSFFLTIIFLSFTGSNPASNESSLVR